VVEALAESEQRAVDHMNDDHLDAIANYARHFAKADGGGWIITGIDVDGIDLASGDDRRRVFFPAALKDAQEMRMALVEMAKVAREALTSQV
jgi:putative heme iron utilization protein